jgi:hypothetical protein
MCGGWEVEEHKDSNNLQRVVMGALRIEVQQFFSPRMWALRW